MNYFLLAISCSSLILVTFKLFERFNIQLRIAILINYVVAAGFGILLTPREHYIDYVVHSSWLYLAIILGVNFLVAFYLFGFATQKVGMAITSVASKMSVILPVLLGFLVLSETATPIKVIGIVVGLVAFYFTLKNDSKDVIRDKRWLILPLLLFLANGLNDSMMKIGEHRYIKDDFQEFLVTIFVISFIVGIIIYLFQKKKAGEWNIRNIIGGVILGILNWFSTYYFLKTLSVWDVSVAVPLFNIAVVLISSLIGFIAFKEKLRLMNWLGIVLAMLAIAAIAIG